MAPAYRLYLSGGGGARCLLLQIPIDQLISAISRDKKNSSTELRLILVDSDNIMKKFSIPNDDYIHGLISDFFKTIYQKVTL